MWWMKRQPNTVCVPACRPLAVLDRSENMFDRLCKLGVFLTQRRNNMRYLKCTVIMILLLSVFLGITASASESETDWANVDWSQVDWYAIDYNQADWESADIGAMIRAMYSRLDEDTEGKRLSRFWDWAENEASWHVVFLISMYTDGASSEAVSDVIYDRFLLDPYAMIKALA